MERKGKQEGEGGLGGSEKKEEERNQKENGFGWCWWWWMNPKRKGDMKDGLWGLEVWWLFPV